LATSHGSALALLVLWPALGLAQVPAQSIDQLKVAVGEGQKITITDRAGHETSGRLVKIAEDTLSLQVQDETVRWELADIRRIQKREADPLGNGILIGALVGAGVSGGMLAYACSIFEGCGPGELTFVALWSAFGGGLGALVDAAHATNRTVYEAPARRTAMDIVPIVTPDARALAVRVTF
jgi:hypothetical protein